MKSITEFAQPILNKILTAKTALASEGKTPEEISASLGETFKLEEPKLKYVQAAADLAAGKELVRRVLVATFEEGETVPSTYQKVDDTHYCVEVLELNRPAPVAQTHNVRGNFNNRSSGGPKGSPWGASPDEAAAKKKALKAAAQAKK